MVNTRGSRRSLALAVGLVLGLAAPAGAQEKGAPAAGGAAASAEWVEQAVQRYREGRYDAAIALADANDTDEHLVSEVVRFFCSLRKSLDERSADATREWSARCGELADRVTGDELDVATAFLADPDPAVRLWAEKLVAAAFPRVVKGVDLPRLRRYVDSPDVRLRRAAIAGIAKILAERRAVVDAGGTIDRTRQALFSDEKLIERLVRQLGDSPVARARLALEPRQLARLGRGDAHACLVLIETPAIPILREAVRDGSRAAQKTLEAIDVEVDRRLRRWPRSTWCSAEGKKPAAGFVGAFCNRCKLPLRPEARYCTECGQDVKTELAPQCRRCRQTLPADSKFCDSCGLPAIQSGGQPLRIPCPNKRCDQVLSPDMTYCPHCGHRVEPHRGP